MRKGFFFVLLFLSVNAVLKAQIPVILRATASEQSDTTGCNFVNELTRITYEAIIGGKAKLWDSPDKEVQITGASLQEIERSSSTSFIDQDVIFIYEFWSNGDRDLKSTTNGFLFSNKDKSGQDVAYGYVSYTDLQEAFLRNRVQTNANGNYNANLATYLHSKIYNYKILQFAGKVVDNATASQKIKDDFIGTLKFNVTAFSRNEIPQKMVIWNLDIVSDANPDKAKSGQLMLKAVEDFLRANEEILYNLNGDRIISHVQKEKWKITKFTVTELWKKINGKIMYDPISVQFFINDSALAEIPYRDLVKMDLLVNQLSLVDFLREKSFLYVITSINSQSLLRKESYIYQKALLTYDWNKLTEFVKYY
ncbi:hypothetical protein BH11BAC2_BH11BAC2_13650 [soil metagenome]